MNFLFSAFLILLLLTPGLIFRIAYLNVDHGARSFKTSFIEEMSFSLFPTVMIHFWGILTIDEFWGQIDVKTIFLILINSDKTIQFLTFNYVKQFSEYLIVIYFISSFLGWLMRLIIEHLNFDINTPIFRLYNQWYYELQGFYVNNETSWLNRLRNKIYKNRKIWKEFVKVENVWLDVLVFSKEDSIIYSGLLTSFVLSKETGLDRIYLSNVKRRKLNEDRSPNDKHEEKKEQEEISSLGDETTIEVNLNNYQNDNNSKIINNYVDARYYDIPGDNFMIPYSEIRNINITYLAMEEEKL